MENYLLWTFALAVAALASAGLAFFLRAYLNGVSPSVAMFRPKTARRLGVVEWASVDTKRKLVLIRRDGVEHLLLTGGPVDVVVETGIPAQVVERSTPTGSEASARKAAVFSRASET